MQHRSPNTDTYDPQLARIYVYVHCEVLNGKVGYISFYIHVSSFTAVETRSAIVMLLRTTRTRVTCSVDGEETIRSSRIYVPRMAHCASRVLELELQSAFRSSIQYT